MMMMMMMMYSCTAHPQWLGLVVDLRYQYWICSFAMRPGQPTGIKRGTASQRFRNFPSPKGSAKAGLSLGYNPACRFRKLFMFRSVGVFDWVINTTMFLFSKTYVEKLVCLASWWCIMKFSLIGEDFIRSFSVLVSFFSVQQSFFVFKKSFCEQLSPVHCELWSWNVCFSALGVLKWWAAHWL